jgi:hypothetical protein
MYYRHIHIYTYWYRHNYVRPLTLVHTDTYTYIHTDTYTYNTHIYTHMV